MGLFDSFRKSKRSNRSPKPRLGFERLEQRAMLAGDFALVKDIFDSPPNKSSIPTNLVALGSNVLFSADSPGIGRELWKSDGTANGTVLVKDLVPESIFDPDTNTVVPLSGDPQNMVVLNNNVYFTTVNFGRIPSEVLLWRTDGTGTGTVPIAIFLDSDIQDVKVIGGFFYFRATTNSAGEELWRSDGTAAGTVMVKDINPGAGSSSPVGFTEMNGFVYFSANDGTNGFELWKTDGTPDGTSLVSDIIPGATSSAPYSLTNVNGILVFGAFKVSSGYELYKSDGTANGTTLLKDIRVDNSDELGSSPFPLKVLNGKLLFYANEDATGYELWTTDGTTGGTTLVKDINTGINGSAISVYASVQSAIIGNSVFFVAYTSANGAEFWKTDGTSAGTSLVKDVSPGIASSFEEGFLFSAIDGIIYFPADNVTNGIELWSSDGTTTGTVLEHDFAPGVEGNFNNFVVKAGSRLFTSEFSSSTGTELYSALQFEPIVYVENSPRKLLFPSTTTIGNSSTSFTNSILTIHNTNGQTTDSLAIVPNSSITVSGAAVAYNGTTIGTITGGSGTTPLFITFNSQATAARVRLVLLAIGFSDSSNTPITAMRTITARLTDGLGVTSQLPTRFVNVLAVNDAPVIGSVGTTATYTENTPRVHVFPAATITDPDTTIFTGGILTIHNTNGQTTDSLAIVPNSSITVSGVNVAYNGTTIGTLTGGSGTTPLVITLNNQATVARVRLVLIAVGFADSSNTPSTAARTITVRVTDGQGGTSQLQSKSVNVTAINDVPVFGSIGAAVSYTEQGPRVIVFPTATITDVDTPIFTGGLLTIHNTNGQSTDSLVIVPNSSITVSGANVRFNGTTIGTFTGGAGTTPLVFTFNNQATVARVRLVLLAVGFADSSNNPSIAPRSVTVRVTDGQGGTSALQIKLVNVNRVNDAPQITGLGGPINYARRAAPVLLASTAVVTDVDTPVLTNGVLRLQTTNGVAGDLISVRTSSSLTVSFGNIAFNGSVFATIAGGNGTTPVVITFNTQASLARVQLLLRSLQFASTTTTASSTPRTISVTLSDGLGGQSPLQNKLVSIV
jgi:ELWxxDGT repeat protein